MECKPGDPADLRNFKKTITSCTLSHGTPTDYVTTSWNDPNVWDLHRPQILPYKETSTPARLTPRKQNTRPIANIDEKQMKSKTLEPFEYQHQNSIHENSQKIFEKHQRYTMLHENPATVCMWFFIRQFVNMQVMRECSYPAAYEKWFARKFEFQIGDQFKNTQLRLLCSCGSKPTLRESKRNPRILQKQTLKK